VIDNQKAQKIKLQKINDPLKKWAKEMKRIFTKEEVQMTKKHIQTCLISLVIKKMQIKTTLIFHLTSARMATIKSTNNNKCWQRCGEKEPSYTAGRNVN
jgi:hypothetical protein